MGARGARPASSAQGGERGEQSNMWAAEDLDQGCFVDGGANLTGMVGGEKGTNSKDNLCEMRGAGPTKSFKEGWEEVTKEGERLEEAGRMVGWG